jgi:hypothetical protein
MEPCRAAAECGRHSSLVGAMMYVSDLAPIELSGIESSRLRAVGWLERGVDYPRGEVPLQFMRALVELLSDPWQPVTYAGVHRCSLCRFSGGPAQFTYIDSHGYAPPEEFQRAVLACPPMRSVAYLKHVKGIRSAGG